MLNYVKFIVALGIFLHSTPSFAETAVPEPGRWICAAVAYDSNTGETTTTELFPIPNAKVSECTKFANQQTFSTMIRNKLNNADVYQGTDIQACLDEYCRERLPNDPALLNVVEFRAIFVPARSQP